MVWPVTPWPIRPASSSTTRTPASCSSSAVVTPTMPPPITATSRGDVAVQARELRRRRRCLEPERALHRSASSSRRISDSALRTLVATCTSGLKRERPVRPVGVLDDLHAGPAVDRRHAQDHGRGADRTALGAQAQVPRRLGLDHLGVVAGASAARSRSCGGACVPGAGNSASASRIVLGTDDPVAVVRPARPAHPTRPAAATDMNLRLVATVLALPRERGANLAVRPMTRARRERAKLGNASSMRGLVLPGVFHPRSDTWLLAAAARRAGRRAGSSNCAPALRSPA